MTADAYVSRSEFQALAQRVDWLDEHGTRGVGAVQVQISELIKDVTRVEVAQEQHAVLHAAEARDRLAGRRWLVASVIVPALVCLITAAATIGVVLAH